MANWIKTEKRFPEEGQVVLVFGENIGRAVAYLDDSGDSFHIGGYYAFDINEVSHWMPLPEKPNEVQ